MGPPVIHSHGLSTIELELQVQGGPSGRGKPPVDSALGYSVILPGQ